MVTKLQVFSSAFSFDIKTTIGESPFTVQWLLEALTEGDAAFVARVKDTSVADVDGYDISGGKGYFSRVYKVTIRFEDCGDPHIVILKVPGIESAEIFRNGEASPINLERVIDCHNREVYFYKHFAPKIEIPLVRVFRAVEWIPGKQMGCILMENLCENSDTASFYGSLSRGQVEAVVKSLAKLHGFFLSTPREQWAGKFQLTIMNTEEIVKGGARTMKEMAEERPEMFKEIASQLLPYMKSQRFYDYTIRDLGVELGIPPILIHGDVWTNNVMFDQRADGSLGDGLRALLDWQIIHDGCIAFDLARLLVISLDGDVRRELEAHMLELYFDSLKAFLAERNLEITFGFGQLLEAYKAAFITQSVFVLLFAISFTSKPIINEFEKKLQDARREKLYLRAYNALEEAVEYLKEIPSDKLL
ncbi:hypothetical protein QR680_010281 [Steinernema hermaphroditum]|uniref:CHK kinase-like domain-containing protein n=1 Tax=Steinernema hermaphroditum TaxID=289476 RepID=A0AA39INF3_9BILA|nr:hypothetical protein QR680_010281 [Steinernema hermaphroditum]